MRVRLGSSGPQQNDDCHAIGENRIDCHQAAHHKREFETIPRMDRHVENETMFHIARKTLQLN